MPGTRAQGKSVSDVIPASSVAAVTAAQVLATYIATFNGRVGAFKAYASTAGSGAGSTGLDVQINGTSIWSQLAARPVLAAASTGEMNNAIGDRGSFRAGDRITIIVATIPATTGHANLVAAAALQAA